jgi:polyisoprenoid-binding protein YceI
VASFPTMSYRSTRAAYDGYGNWEIDGELTIRDITLPQRLQARFRGVTRDAYGKTRAGFHAAGELRRQGFNLLADLPNEVGELPVGADVVIEVDVEVVLRT